MKNRRSSAFTAQTTLRPDFFIDTVLCQRGFDSANMRG